MNFTKSRFYRQIFISLYEIWQTNMTKLIGAFHRHIRKRLKLEIK